MWADETRERIKRKNSIYFAKDSSLLLPLADLLSQVSRKAVVLWGLELAGEGAAFLYQRHPEETKPLEAVQQSALWAMGKIKMRPAQRAILDCHSLAKQWNDPEEIALCHAVGQGCAVVHTPGHALGYPMYGLTALVHRFGRDNWEEAVAKRAEQYWERLLFWQEHPAYYGENWAAFIENAEKK